MDTIYIHTTYTNMPVIKQKTTNEAFSLVDLNNGQQAFVGNKSGRVFYVQPKKRKKITMEEITKAHEELSKEYISYE